MRVLIFLEHTFYKSNEGQLYCEKVITNDYIKRYTSVFSSITICARENKQIESYIDVPLSNVDFLALPNYNSNKVLMRMDSLVQLIGNSIHDYDAIIIRGPSSISILGYNIAKKSKVPFIAEIVINPCNFFNNNTKNIVKNVIYFFEKKYLVNHTKKLCQKANGVSYVTSHNLQNLFPSTAKLNGTTEVYFEEHYSSIDLRQEDYTDQIFPYSKNSDFVLCHTGWMMGHNKGHIIVMDIVKKLLEKGYRIKVKFIGDGPLMSEFVDYSKRLGIQENIIFLGKKNNYKEIQKELITSHLFIFPSQAEGLPRSVIEAMANSLPCAASNIDGMSELLSTEVLFNLQDLNSIVFLVEKFISNNEYRIKEAKRNYKKSKEYSYDILSKRRFDFYTKLYNLVNKKNSA